MKVIHSISVLSRRPVLFALVGLLGVGLQSSKGAVLERDYDFSLEVGFASSTHTATSFGNSVNLRDDRSTSVEISPFDSALGILEAVIISFSTSESSYQFSLSTTTAAWNDQYDPGFIRRELTVTSLDPRVTLPEAATDFRKFDFSWVTSLSENIGGASVAFDLSFSDSASLEAFTGETPLEFQIESLIHFYGSPYLTTKPSGKGTVSSSGNYAGTVSVAYLYQAIPEPSTALLVGGGLLALLAWRRQRVGV